MADLENTLELEDEDLFATRESLDLTKENARFFPSEGGLISMTLCKGDGSEETFERVVPIRAFPISDPEEFISIREPESREKGKGAEIGMIRRLSDFDGAGADLIAAELARRYFTPAILKITGVKEKFGYSYWNVETSAGKISFVLNNPSSNIRTLEDGRVFVHDIEGNCFEIPDPEKLDKASLKKIEIYL